VDIGRGHAGRRPPIRGIPVRHGVVRLDAGRRGHHHADSDRDGDADADRDGDAHPDRDRNAHPLGDPHEEAVPDTDGHREATHHPGPR
jgi:hypothetical protein